MNEQLASSRRYDLDWLRIIAILLLLFYHAGMTFNTWEWHIKNSETSKIFSIWMLPLHYIRMPLLLFISGAGTQMALSKVTVGRFVTDRFKRLVIPFVFGLAVLGPIMVYFQYMSQFSSYWDIYKSFFDFIPFHDGTLNWYHLWFIGYLFVYSLLCLPVLIFLRSPKYEEIKASGIRFSLHPIVILLVPACLITLTQLILRHGLTYPFEGWAFFVYYLCFFLFGIVGYSSSSVREAIGSNKRYLLTFSLLILLLRFVGYLFKQGNDFLDTNTMQFANEVYSIFLSWFSVITIIAFGQSYLNRPVRFLTRMTEGAYPFYILHQPFLIAISYYVCQLSWSISAKYWTLCILTLAVTISFYIFFIRPFNAMRFLFGLKMKPVEEGLKAPSV